MSSPPTAGSLRLRRLALVALITNVLIVFSGGLVRVTGSGLGCPTWPRCSDEGFVPTAGGEHAGWQTAVEFGNRLLTFVVLAAALAVVWEMRRQRAHHPPRLWHLALALPLGVLLQAVLGGVTVLTGLTPWTVAAHFLLSMALIGIAATLHEWLRAPEREAAGGGLRRATTALLVVGAGVLVLGTLVTGAGPHGGDPQTPRLGIDIRTAALAHADAVWLFVGLTLALVVVTWRGPAGVRRALRTLLALQLAQGAVGYAQYALGVPPALVAVHILGAALLWTASVTAWARARPASVPAPATSTVEPETRLPAGGPLERPGS